MTDLAFQLVSEEEGCTLTAKPDAQGLWEIGWGHDLPRGGSYEGLTWTQAHADQQLTLDLATARLIAPHFPYFGSMNEVRQAVCVSMAYQLGNKPLGWPQFMAALTSQDYTAAAAAGLDTLWEKLQTPKRATREMAMLKTGEWVEHL